MALLNVSFSSKLTPKPPLSLPKPHLSHPYFSPLSLQIPPQNLLFSLRESVAKAGLLALLSSSLFFVDPALAFKGGGPYGSEVTRGQDLSGKDFSGKRLIKQDFKTSILRQSNFKGAKLLGASFFDSDLTGADLSDADLRGADFSLANVTKANLSNANLEGALATGNTSFKGSTITGAGWLDPIMFPLPLRLRFHEISSSLEIPVTGKLLSWVSLLAMLDDFSLRPNANAKMTSQMCL